MDVHRHSLNVRTEGNLLDRSMLKTMLQVALNQAKATQPKETELGKIHAELSQAWVNALTAQFQNVYQAANHRVFSRSCSRWHGHQEVLFDIHVCTVECAESPWQKKNIGFITGALWQVESELRPDTSALVSDFEKLVVGSAENKLFIAPGGPKHIEKWIPFFARMAANCSGVVYVAFISEPKDWVKPPANESVRLFVFTGEGETGWSEV